MPEHILLVNMVRHSLWCVVHLCWSPRSAALSELVHVGLCASRRGWRSARFSLPPHSRHSTSCIVPWSSRTPCSQAWDERRKRHGTTVSFCLCPWPVHVWMFVCVMCLRMRVHASAESNCHVFVSSSDFLKHSAQSIWDRPCFQRADAACQRFG